MTAQPLRIDERNHAEKPLLAQLAGLGWEIVGSKAVSDTGIVWWIVEGDAWSNEHHRYSPVNAACPVVCPALDAEPTILRP